MALSTVEWIEINGSRYLWEPHSLRRSSLPLELPQLTAKRVQAPFVDSEIVSYAGGAGVLTMDAEASGYRSAYGLEPVFAGLNQTGLRVGRQLVSRSPAGTAVAVHSPLGWNGLLYGIGVDQEELHEWNGSAWNSRDWSGTLAALGNSLLLWERKLWIGCDNTNEFVTWDGSAFALGGFTSTGGSNTLLATHLTTGLWWAAQGTIDTIAHSVSIRSRPSVAGSTTVHATHRGYLAHHRIAAVAGTTLYYWLQIYTGATAEPGWELWSIDLASPGTPAMVTTERVQFVCDSAVHLGELYVLTKSEGAQRASVRKLSGSTLVTVGQFEMDGGSGIDDFAQLMSTGAGLYLAYVDQGASSGKRLRLWLYRDAGWHLISYGGADTLTAVYGLGIDPVNRRIIITTRGAAAGSYEHGTSSRLTAAELESPDAVYGVPNLPKRYRRAGLPHSALLSGQAIETRYRLEEGSEVSVGTNRDVGSTETVFELPESLLGKRARVRWYLTNGSSQDLIIYPGASIRALPAPEEREVLEADLQLAPLTGTFSDAVADTDDALTKWERLRDLRRSATPFQVVDPFRDGTTIKRAMLAVFDPQVPLDWTLEPLSAPLQLRVPIRLIQAAGPQNLLLNSSFEQDSAGSAPTSWSATGTGTSSNVSTAVAAQDGSNVLAIVFDGVSGTYGRFQTISGLVPGRYYTLSLYVRRTLSAGSFRAQVEHPSTTALAGSTITLAAATDTAFARYSGTFQYPSNGDGTAIVALVGITTPAGTVYVDAVMVEESAPASTYRERGSGG